MKCSLTTTIRGKFCYLLNKSDLLATRFILSLSSFLWGSMLLIPGDTFDRPMFAVISKIMPEEIWGILFFAHAVAALCSLFIGMHKKVLLILDSILGCFLWTSITLGMLFSLLYTDGFQTAPAATSPSIILTLVSWWLLARYPSDLK